MKKKIIITLSLSFALTLYSSISLAGGQCNVPTIPDNYTELLKYDPANPSNIDPGATEDIAVIGGQPPFQWTSSGPASFQSYSTNPDRVNPLTAEALTCDKIDVTITDSTVDPVTGNFDRQSVSGTLNDSYEPLRFVDAEAGANGQGGWYVEIDGGKGPYTYTIQGTDFSFEYPDVVTSKTTMAKKVEIYNTDQYCNTNITITDQCGDTVPGYVRGVGSWQPNYSIIYVNECINGEGTLPEYCNIKGEADNYVYNDYHPDDNWWEKASGKYQIRLQAQGSTGEYNCYEGPVPPGPNPWQYPPNAVIYGAGGPETCQDFWLRNPSNPLDGYPYDNCPCEGNRYRLYCNGRSDVNENNYCLYQNSFSLNGYTVKQWVCQ